MAGIGCAAVRRIILFALFWFDSTITEAQKFLSYAKATRVYFLLRIYPVCIGNLSSAIACTTSTLSRF